MIKVSKHNNANSNHKDINKDITKIVIIVIINQFKTKELVGPASQ